MSIIAGLKHSLTLTGKSISLEATVTNTCVTIPVHEIFCAGRISVTRHKVASVYNQTLWPIFAFPFQLWRINRIKVVKID